MQRATRALRGRGGWLRSLMILAGAVVICVAGSATAVLASGSTNSFYVDQTAPASGVVSQPFAWTIGVHNDGTGADEHSITVTDTLPAGLTADSETGDCTDDGDGGTGTDTVECVIGTLPDSSSTSETVSATPTTTGTMTNVVNGTAKYYGSGGITDEQTLTAPTSTLTTPVSVQSTGTTTTTTTSTPPPTTTTSSSATTTTSGPALASAQLAPIGGSSQGGTDLLIEGSDFKRTTGVWIGAQQITDFHVDSDNQISLLTPPHSDGGEPVTVFTPSATYTATFTYFDDPRVYELQPSDLPACCGGLLFIHGIALEHVTGVQVNGQSVPIVGRGQGGLADDGWGWIGVNVPPGQGSVPLTVTAPTGSDTVSLAYGSAPELDDIQPEAGPSVGGYTATLIGSNFTPGMTATFASVTVGVTVLSPTRAQVQVPSGSGRETVAVSTAGGRSQLQFPFDYEPSPCESIGSCSFSAWAEVDSAAKGPQTAASKHDQQPSSGAGTCVFSTHLFGCPLGKGPAKAQTGALVSGASAAANSSAEPFGAAINLLTNTAKGAHGTADGGTESTDSWVITPIPDKPIQAEVVVSFAANTAIGTLGVSSGSVSGDWEASFQDNTLKGSVTRNVAYDKDSHDITALESEQTWLNGSPLPPAPSYVLPEVLNPKQWNEIWVSSYLDGVAQASGAEGTADYSAALDPVVIPLTPGYEIKTRAPGRLAHTAIIAALSRAWARPGATVRLMGAGFGRRRGSVSILHAGAKRATRVTVVRWSAGGVLVRMPRHTRPGEAWIFIKPAHATKSNVVPLVIARGQPPTILHLSRGSGRAGQKVRITGVALAALRWVKFGGRKARIRNVGGRLVAIVPRGHGTVAVTAATRTGVSMPNVNAVFRYR